MRKLLIFLILFCVSCGSSYHYQYTSFAPISQGKHIPVYVDIQFGDADRVSIENAINSWNYVLNGSIKLDVISYEFDMAPQDIYTAVNHHGILILKVNSDNPIVPNDNKGSVIGFAEVGGNLLYLVRDKLNDEVEQVLLHELGHILGSGHLQGESLMNPIYSSKYSGCIDERTMEEVAKYQHLDAKKLNYCIYN